MFLQVLFSLNIKEDKKMHISLLNTDYQAKFEVLTVVFTICNNFMCSFSQNVPAKPPSCPICLQDNLADCTESGGLVATLQVCQTLL